MTKFYIETCQKFANILLLNSAMDKNNFMKDVESSVVMYKNNNNNCWTYQKQLTKYYKY